ncbi:MAG: monovalent cation/H+ antiporter subunit D family protein, partial [Planctomycetes bacterium]|nr:monovalent cation/H+ antiporter subunit D family protein [Planctomycetota bacterium]
MDTIISIKPFLAVIASLVVVIPIVLSSAKPNLREGWTFAAAIIKFLIVVSMVPIVLGGGTIEYTLVEVMPGIAIRFRVDSLGLLFALVASTLWILTSIYSIGYMRSLKEHSQTRFFSFFALALSATIGVAFAANLFTLYLFYEMLSLATYPLVTHHQDLKARSSGRKYLSFILGTSIAFVLPAMLITYSLTGTLEFSVQGILAGKASTTTITVLLVMFIFGFAKAGIMPF